MIACINKNLSAVKYKISKNNNYNLLEILLYTILLSLLEMYPIFKTSFWNIFRIMILISYINVELFIS